MFVLWLLLEITHLDCRFDLLCSLGPWVLRFTFYNLGHLKFDKYFHGSQVRVWYPMSYFLFQFEVQEEDLVSYHWPLENEIGCHRLDSSTKFPSHVSLEAVQSQQLHKYRQGLCQLIYSDLLIFVSTVDDLWVVWWTRFYGHWILRKGCVGDTSSLDWRHTWVVSGPGKGWTRVNSQYSK